MFNSSGKALKFELNKVMLSKEESMKINQYAAKAQEKYGLDPKNSSILKQLYENTIKHYKVMKESMPALTSGDVDVFRDIALIATTKAYIGNILEYVASVQPIANPYDFIYTVDWQYADDDAADNISAGDRFVDKRSKAYTQHTELQPSRKIKSKVTRRPIDAQVRSIEMSETLEAILSLKSIYGEQAQDFLNNTYLDVIAAKLKDEMELYMIDKIANSVPATNVVAYSTSMLDGTECINAKCQAMALFEAIEEAANRVFNKTGIRPNVAIVGSQALSIMRKGGLSIVRYNKEGLPISTARNYIGVLEDAFNLVYEPTVSGVLLVYKHPTNTVESSVVYAPHIPLGITPSIWDRDLSVYRVVYTVDALEIVHPELLARVDIV